MNFKSLIAALTISALTIFWVSLAFQVLNSTYNTGKHRLGYEGPAIEVVSLYDRPVQTMSPTVESILANYGLSVAYERQLDSGILTIVDPAQRFKSADGPLIPDTHARGDTSSWIGVNEGIEISQHDVFAAMDVEFEILTLVSSELLLFSSVQAMYVSPDLQPFESGRYFFAGDTMGNEEAIDKLLDVLTRSGFHIVSATTLPDTSSFLGSLAIFFTATYRIIVFLFTLTALIIAYVALWGCMTDHRQKLKALAICGAHRVTLRRFAFLFLARHTVVGLIIASFFSAGVVLFLHGISTTPLPIQSLTVLVGIAISGLISLVMARVIAEGEVRRISNVLPV